jgi:hypothetical protein
MLNVTRQKSPPLLTGAGALFLLFFVCAFVMWLGASMSPSFAADNPREAIR